jgi:hypothetical protein
LRSCAVWLRLAICRKKADNDSMRDPVWACALMLALTSVQCSSSTNPPAADATIGGGGTGGGQAVVEAGTSGSAPVMNPVMDMETNPVGATDYRPCPTNGDPCKLLPLGDSITFGVGSPGGYRAPLFHAALDAKKSLTFVGTLMDGPDMVDGVAFAKNHEGHSGWEIGQINDLIPSPVVEQAPDIILLMAGTNDCANVKAPDTAPERLGKLLDDITTSDDHVLLVVARPIPMVYDDKNVCVQNIGARLPGLVKERVAAGKHIVLVNQYTGFPLSELGDGLHPNAAGYARMAGVWFQFLKDALP